MEEEIAKDQGLLKLHVLEACVQGMVIGDLGPPGQHVPVQLG